MLVALGCNCWLLFAMFIKEHNNISCAMWEKYLNASDSMTVGNVTLIIFKHCCPSVDSL